MGNRGTINKAVIPVAGLGTRFLPATKATPKEMLPVVDKPAIQYVVEEAVAAGRLGGVQGDLVERKAFVAARLDVPVGGVIQGELQVA